MSTASSPIIRKVELLEGWHKGLRVLQRGNFAASTHYGKIGKRFGVPVVISTSVVSSSIFATIGDSAHAEIQLLAGAISLLATVLSSLQTFLGYSERSSWHKEAAAGYGELRTEVQVLLASDLAAISDLDSRIESIRARWNALDKISPTIPRGIYEETAKAIEQSKHHPEH